MSVLLHDFVQVLELQKYGVKLEWCQLVRYENGGTLRKPFDEPEVGTHLASFPGPKRRRRKGWERG